MPGADVDGAPMTVSRFGGRKLPEWHAKTAGRGGGRMPNDVKAYVSAAVAIVAIVLAYWGARPSDQNSALSQAFMIISMWIFPDYKTKPLRTWRGRHFNSARSTGQCNTACSLSAGVSKPKVFLERGFGKPTQWLAGLPFESPHP
jgi:hypothetical protein